MLALAPRHLPPLHLMLADLGYPSADQLAALLGVSRRTVYRWQLAGEAPRAVLLALFWLTRWGRSAVECQAVNDATLQAALARNARETAEKRAAELEHVLRLGNFGSANAPLLTAPLSQLRPPAALDDGEPPRPALPRPAAKPARQRVKARRLGGR